MNRFLKSYTSFNKTERAGLVGLLIILFLLIIVKSILPYCVVVKPDELKRQQLLAKWQGLQKNKSGNIATIHEGKIDTTNSQYIDNQQSTARLTEKGLFKFDPNTLDSLGFIKLGLPTKTTATLLHWRAKGKIFRHKEELKKVYTLTESDYTRIEPYISIKQNIAIRKLNLNTADSAALVALNGIGPKLAHKILEYRKVSGPFTSYDQLYEVYRFPDTVFRQLSSNLVIQ